MLMENYDSAAFFALDEVPGFKRDFSLNDTSLQHPCVAPLLSSLTVPDILSTAMRRKIEYRLDSFHVIWEEILILSLQDWALYMIAFVAPLVIQTTVDLLTIRSWWDFHNGFLGRM